MAGTRKSTEHIELSDALSAWASKYDLNQDNYILGLGTALRSRKNLPFWSTLSPIDYLPHPEVKVSGSRLHNWLTLLRNTLIFAPVALTWSAVGHATDAFGTYVGQNAGSVVNFLEFWQNGYGALADSWRIGHVANLDFALIASVIVLILFLHFDGQKIHSRKVKAVDSIENERLDLAIRIGEYLFSKRAISDLTMKDSLASATQDLLQTGSSLGSLAKSIEKANKEAPTNKQVMAELKKFSKLIPGNPLSRNDSKS